MVKLRNVNISLSDNVNIAINKEYIYSDESDEKTLKKIKIKVKDTIRVNRGIVKNKSTGKISKINSKTIGKILYPSNSKNVYSKKYIDRLNASFKIKELFENAVYIDSFKPMKGKEENINEISFHHFVSLIYMRSKLFIVSITVRDKVNSSTVYLSGIEKFDCDKKIYDSITVCDLFKQIKLYDYYDERMVVYSSNDFVCDGEYYQYLFT